MRKPNGYGSIKKLSGNRRRPFVFVVSVGKKQKPVEYFTTQIEAEIFQADYNKTHNHRSLPGHQITLTELYHRGSRHTHQTHRRPNLRLTAIPTLLNTWSRSTTNHSSN